MHELEELAAAAMDAFRRAAAAGDAEAQRALEDVDVALGLLQRRVARAPRGRGRGEEPEVGSGGGPGGPVGSGGGGGGGSAS